MGRRGVLSRPLVAIVAVAIAACSADSEAPAEWTVVTEALPGGGSRVVNTPPAVDEGPTWWIEEELRIGTLDDPGPTSFGEIRGIGLTDDGRIAVLETQSQELRIFRENGEHEATFGGKGGGPGEFENAFGLMQGPDGLFYIPDTRNARMSVMHPTDGYVRSHPLRLLRFGYIWGGVMDAEGHILKTSLILEEDRRPVIRVYDREMNEIETRDLPAEPDIDQEDPPMSWAFKTANGGGYMSVPWYPRELRALDASGDIWSTTLGDPSYRIFRWSPGGDTTLVIETVASEIPVTSAERDSAFEAALVGIERSGGTIEGDASKIPTVKPSVQRMHLSAEGQLWVRRPSETGITLYDVYDRDGRRVGSAATDVAHWQYLAPIIQQDVLLAVTTDELDVPYVVRGRLVPFECRSGNPAVSEVESVCLEGR